MLNNTSVNKVILMGRIGTEPRIHHNGDQKMLCFQLITIEKLKRNGESEFHQEWHHICINTHLANFKELVKGRLVYLQGRLQTRQYIDEHQVKHYKAEVMAYSIEPVEVQLKLV